MPYCFIDKLPAQDGQASAPAGPAGIRFNLLADLPGLPWGLFDVAENDGWSPEHLVSDRLAALIESAKRYPPALGIARAEMHDVFGDQHPSQYDFASSFGTALRTHLRRQHESPYVLAPAMRDDPGYLAKGQWYWVLGISGLPPSASWVSDDFRIYESDMNDFDLTGQQLKHLGFSG